MAIDRVFAVQGHGTVVTGSVSAGQVSVGDDVELQPTRQVVRVRGLHHHDRLAESVRRGQRAAINLAGVHHSEIERGRELAAVGYLKPSRVMTAWLRLLPNSPWAFKHRARVHCHFGTTELFASVSLLEEDAIAPGGEGLAQLFLAEPAVAAWGQPLVIRSESPVLTIGGGQVLQPCARRLRRRQADILQRLRLLRGGDAFQRAAEAVYFRGLDEWTQLDLCRDAGLLPEEARELTQRLFDEHVLVELGDAQRRSFRLHEHWLADLGERVERALARLHEEFPLQNTISRQRLVSRFDYLGDETLAQAVVERLRRRGRIHGNDREVSLEGHGPKLSPAERKLLEQVLDAFRQSGYQPPELSDLQKQAQVRASAVPQIVELCVAQGELTAIGGGVYLHREWDEEMRRRIRERLKESPGLSVSQIRDLLGTTRKFAVPICEYLDRVGFTRREGDLRVLAASV